MSRAVSDQRNEPMDSIWKRDRSRSFETSKGLWKEGPDRKRARHPTIVAIGPIRNADCTASDIHSNYPHGLQRHPCAGQPFQPGKDKP